MIEAGSEEAMEGWGEEEVGGTTMDAEVEGTEEMDQEENPWTNLQTPGSSS